jgi:hypothetical protein
MSPLLLVIGRNGIMNLMTQVLASKVQVSGWMTPVSEHLRT